MIREISIANSEGQSAAQGAGQPFPERHFEIGTESQHIDIGVKGAFANNIDGLGSDCSRPIGSRADERAGPFKGAMIGCPWNDEIRWDSVRIRNMIEGALEVLLVLDIDGRITQACFNPKAP